MDKMTQILDIPSIKNDTNFWMVRAKRGFFFDEFIRNEFIAIGWNSVTKASLIGRFRYRAVPFFGTKKPRISACSSSNSFTFLSMPPA